MHFFNFILAADAFVIYAAIVYTCERETTSLAIQPYARRVWLV